MTAPLDPTEPIITPAAKALPPLKDAKILLAAPTYDGSRINADALIAAGVYADVSILYTKNSLLAWGFNIALAHARVMRDKGDATHFVMLHADIDPEHTAWLLELWNAYHQVDAQLMAAVVPIKSDERATSTAMETDDPWQPKRLAIKDVMDACPKGSFTVPGLLLNTGMMIFDLRQDWVDKCWFTVQDRIVMVDGQPSPQCIPEDWGFTRQARAAGCERIYATTAVPLWHHGNKKYGLAEVGA